MEVVEFPLNISKEFPSHCRIPKAVSQKFSSELRGQVWHHNFFLKISRYYIFS